MSNLCGSCITLSDSWSMWHSSRSWNSVLLSIKIYFFMREWIRVALWHIWCLPLNLGPSVSECLTHSLHHLWGCPTYFALKENLLVMLYHRLQPLHSFSSLKTFRKYFSVGFYTSMTSLLWCPPHPITERETGESRNITALLHYSWVICGGQRPVVVQVLVHVKHAL